MDVFSVWKRHIVSLGSSLGTPKDMSVAFERRGARPHYVRHEGEVWLSDQCFREDAAVHALEFCQLGCFCDLSAAVALMMYVMLMPAMSGRSCCARSPAFEPGDAPSITLFICSNSCSFIGSTSQAWGCRRCLKWY